MIPKEKEDDLQLGNRLKGTYVSPSDPAPNKLYKQRYLIGQMLADSRAGDAESRDRAGEHTLGHHRPKGSSQ